MSYRTYTPALARDFFLIVGIEIYRFSDASDFGGFPGVILGLKAVSQRLL